MSDGPSLVGALREVFEIKGKPHKGKHRFYHEFSSYFNDLDVSHDAEMAEMIRWHRENCKGSWAWETENHNVYNDEGKVVDVLPRIVFSFDLSGDAMLSRMTWLDLKRYPHADSRGRARNAG